MPTCSATRPGVRRACRPTHAAAARRAGAPPALQRLARFARIRSSPELMARRSVHLYRAVLRAVARLPVEPVRRKLRWNARQLWALNSHTTDPETVQALHEDAAAAVRVLRWLSRLPQVRGSDQAAGMGVGGAPPAEPRPLGPCTPKPPPPPPTRRRPPPPFARRLCRSIPRSSSSTSAPQLSSRGRPSRAASHGGAVPRGAAGAVHRAHPRGCCRAQVQQAA